MLKKVAGYYLFIVVVDNIKYLLELQLKESLAAVVDKENIGAKIDKALETPNP